MLRTKAIPAALILLQLIGCTETPTPPTREIGYAHLRPLAGSNATDCGHIGLHGNSEKAKTCAQTAVENSRPFFVAYDEMGIDSLIMYGLASDGHGKAWRVDYDSWGWATYDLPKGATLTDKNHTLIIPCSVPVKFLTSERGYVSCKKLDI